MNIYDIIFITLLFLIGISWGSFLNVWIYRIPEKRSFAKGRSACMTCGHTLSHLDLVPLFSFLFLKGRCRYCKVKLSKQYPFVELLVGILFLITYFSFGLDTYAWAMSLFLITVNVVIGIIDWNTTFIPNVISYPCIVIGLISAILYNFLPYNEYNPITSTFYAVLTGVLFFVIFLVMYFISNGGMGMGDAKWSLFIGFILGYEKGVLALLLASLVSSLYTGLIMLIFRKKIKSLPNNSISKDDEDELPIDGKFLGVSIINGKPAIVLGPFLAMGCLVSWFFGQHIIEMFYLL